MVEVVKLNITETEFINAVNATGFTVNGCPGECNERGINARALLDHLN